MISGVLHLEPDRLHQQLPGVCDVCIMCFDLLAAMLNFPQLTNGLFVRNTERFSLRSSTDQVLEKAMHKCVLKPLKAVVSSALQEFQIRSGEWQELKENLSQAKARQPQEMGVADAQPPDTVAIEKIKHKFHTMCKLYSPEKKVSMLLRVCKLIYTIMEDNSGTDENHNHTHSQCRMAGMMSEPAVCLTGRLYGADDFLPMLTYVLAQCDMPQLDNEILYMMELLDPSLLHGEGVALFHGNQHNLPHPPPPT